MRVTGAFISSDSWEDAGCVHDLVDSQWGACAQPARENLSGVEVARHLTPRLENVGVRPRSHRSHRMAQSTKAPRSELTERLPREALHDSALSDAADHLEQLGVLEDVLVDEGPKRSPTTR